MKIVCAITFAAVCLSHCVFAGTLTPQSGFNGSSPEGVAIGGTMASFLDSDPNELPSSFSSTINWGDNTASSGQIVSLGGGLFNVVASHTYAEEGPYPMTVTVSNTGGSQAIMIGVDNVADAPLTGGSTAPMSGTEGQVLSTPSLASFTDLNPLATSSEFTSIIDWGDNTFSRGTVVQNGGQFMVAAAHAYSEEGTHPYVVHIMDDGGSTVTLTGTSVVADAPLQSSPVIPPILTQGTVFDGPVALLTDLNPLGLATDFMATINWGDGTPSASGTLVSLGGGQFEIFGLHAYVNTGPYNPDITLLDKGGSFTESRAAVLVETPEPASLAMMGAGAMLLALARRCHR
jgi:hypothetical protein